MIARLRWSRAAIVAAIGVAVAAPLGGCAPVPRPAVLSQADEVGRNATSLASAPRSPV